MSKIVPFLEFPKIPRLYRDIIITEKIDGTNAVIFVPEQDEQPVLAGSRSRWLSPGKDTDNFTFAQWVREHEQELRVGLGPGYHYGEWWGLGIQRGYGINEKRFSLFNTTRWVGKAPVCCGVTPVIYEGEFSAEAIRYALALLDSAGSIAAPDFKPAEGIVVYHSASNALFKVTLKNDRVPKELDK